MSIFTWPRPWAFIMGLSLLLGCNSLREKKPSFLSGMKPLNLASLGARIQPSRPVMTRRSQQQFELSGQVRICQWACSGGSISPWGLYTAPDAPGKYLITVRDDELLGVRKTTVEVRDFPGPSLDVLPVTMRRPRVGHSSTLLPDGSVLIAGGGSRFYGGGPCPTDPICEIYDPQRQSFTEGTSLCIPRFDHRALLWKGDVWIVGGMGCGRRPVQEIERIDGKTGKASIVGRTLHAYTQLDVAALPDHALLIVGSHAGETHPVTQRMRVQAELFLPTTQKSMALESPTLRDPGALVSHTDGRILLVGGGMAEVFDPRSRKFTFLGRAAWAHAPAFLQRDGRLLSFSRYENHLHLVDLESRGDTPIPLNHRISQDSTLLSEASLLFFLGGTDPVRATSNGEFFDLSTKQFRPIQGLPRPTLAPSVCRLGDGRFLITGGRNGACEGVEVYSQASLLSLEGRQP